MRLHYITALLLAAPLVGTAAAQDSTQIPKQSKDTLGQQMSDSSSMRFSDDMVLMRMHKTNQLEIRVGQLAQRNGSSAKVKAFGSRLLRDHSAAEQKGTPLGKKLGLTSARRAGMDSTEC